MHDRAQKAGQAPSGSAETATRATDRVRPFRIALLGGIASGKSTVSKALQRLGAIHIDADAISHEILAGAEATREVRARWGDAVLDAGGRCDRKKIAAIVFKDPAELSALEAILHPRIFARIDEKIAELSTPLGARRNVVIIDVPLAHKEVVRTSDLKIYVDASLETRKKRARDLRGWSDGELERRESSQLSLEEKRAMADVVVQNDRGVSEAEEDVERIWSSLVRPRIEGPGR